MQEPILSEKGLKLGQDVREQIAYQLTCKSSL